MRAAPSLALVLLVERVELLTVDLRQGTGRQAAQEISGCDAPHTAVRLLKGRETCQAHRTQDLVREVRVGQQVSRFRKEFRGLLLIKEDLKVLCGQPRWPCRGAAARCP